MTRKGIDCAEKFDGSVSRYMEKGSGEDRSVNIHNPVSSNLMVGTISSQQKAAINITPTSPDVKNLLALLRAIAEAVPVLGLPPDEASRLARDVEVVEAELVDKDRDQGVARTLLNRTLATLGATVNSSLALVLSAYAKELARKLGLHIE